MHMHFSKMGFGCLFAKQPVCWWSVFAYCGRDYYDLITNLAVMLSDSFCFASWRVTFFLLAQKQSHQTKKAPTSAENSYAITEITGRSDAPSVAQLTFTRRPVASLDNLSNYSGGTLTGVVRLRSWFESIMSLS